MSRNHARVASVAAGTLIASGLVAPVAAHAAPPSHSEPQVADLVSRELRNQKLDWHTCQFPDVPEATAKKLLAVPGVQCATITVPRDWYRARDGQTIKVEISKVPAKNPAKRRGIMLLNPGGPGGSGLGWGPAIQLRSPDVAEAYDTIGFDPRGVGQSTKLVCTYDSNAKTQAEAAKKYADGCLQNPLTPFITTRQTTLDMDFVRHLLGERKMSYIGYSYGTWLGGSYATTFPSRTDRFILDSSVDMSKGTLEATWDLQPATRDRQFQDMMLPFISRHDDVYGLGTDPMAIRKRFEETGGFDNYVNLIVGVNTVISAMYDTSQYEKAAAVISVLAKRNPTNDRMDFRDPYGIEAQKRMPQVMEEVRSEVAKLKISEKSKNEVSRSLDEGLAEYREAAAPAPQAPKLKQDDGAFEAIRCQDGQWTTDLNVWATKLDEGFKKAPLTSMLQSIPACAFWPAKEKGFPELKDQKIPGVLFLQSEFDAATAYEGAKGSITKFKASKALLVDNEGSHGLFPYGTECVDAPALNWLLAGKLPKNKWSSCVGSPLPGEIYTYNVGGTVNKNGQLKGFKMETEAVKEANAIVAELRKKAGIPDTPGDDAGLAEVSRSLLPTR
ncbi:alpha/beta fold hydrolase [Mariniluteicoccus flavus]